MENVDEPCSTVLVFFITSYDIIAKIGPCTCLQICF